MEVDNNHYCSVWFELRRVQFLFFFAGSFSSLKENFFHLSSPSPKLSICLSLSTSIPKHSYIITSYYNLDVVVNATRVMKDMHSVVLSAAMQCWSP